MRSVALAAGFGALALLAACDPPPTPEAEAPPIVVPQTRLETFEDNGCLGYLLLQRRAVSEGGAQGDVAAFDAAVTAWRAAGARILPAGELTQYEATSVAVQDSEPDDVIAERAAACVTSAPQ